MPSNFIDVGAIQGATKQDVGAMQTSGGTTVNEVITLGVTAGETFSLAALANASLALGVGAGTSPAAPIAVDEDVALGATLDLTLAGTRTKEGFVQVDVLATLDLAPTALTHGSIALGIGAGIQFVDTIHFGTTRRGKTAVVVAPKFTGKATVR